MMPRVPHLQLPAWLIFAGPAISAMNSIRIPRVHAALPDFVELLPAFGIGVDPFCRISGMPSGNSRAVAVRCTRAIDSARRRGRIVRMQSRHRPGHADQDRQDRLRVPESPWRIIWIAGMSYAIAIARRNAIFRR